LLVDDDSSSHVSAFGATVTVLPVVHEPAATIVHV
jgi:hypothetical protein